MGDIAHDNGWDGVEFRLKNCIREGFVEEFTPGGAVAAHTCTLPQCVEKGKKWIHWDEKKREYANETGPIRHGVGVAFFVYKTAVAPFALETATSRVTLNQDGTVQLQMGATEIGQGADTVFSQMAAEAIGIDTEDVHIVSFQDTDVARPSRRPALSCARRSSPSRTACIRPPARTSTCTITPSGMPLVARYARLPRSPLRPTTTWTQTTS